MPGAKNIPLDTIYNQEGTGLLPKESLEKRMSLYPFYIHDCWHVKAGLLISGTPFAYSHRWSLYQGLTVTRQ